MKYTVKPSSAFKKDYKAALKRGYDMTLLNEVVAMLANGEALPEKYQDHALKGNYLGYRDCHITPDWILIYKVEEDMLILALTRTGTHSDLF
ncbi:MAG: type II toxin-antitoxin system YafQ family toxin [Oscillospiraceae bacterium]|jgi:mRNA interferase YafQ|nr:type II toxin-antitoxin system YafQ family toxin [Oscillospiraceae bacterium]